MGGRQIYLENWKMFSQGRFKLAAQCLDTHTWCIIHLKAIGYESETCPTSVVSFRNGLTLRSVIVLIIRAVQSDRKRARRGRVLPPFHFKISQAIEGGLLRHSTSTETLVKRIRRVYVFSVEEHELIEASCRKYRGYQIPCFSFHRKTEFKCTIRGQSPT